MKLCALSSGSNGNAILVYTEQSTLLVDAGISARRICEGMQQLGLSPRQLDGILITHDHSDHISGLRVLLRRTEAPVYATEETAAELAQALDCSSRLRIIHPLEPLVLGQLTLLPFPTSHDTGGSIGCTISACGRKCAIVTDSGHITETIRRCVYGAHLALVESNYDPEWLAHGPYPHYLKARIGGDCGHLSNEDCGAFCCELSAHGTEKLVLGHLSEQNNSPQRAKAVVCGILSASGHRTPVAVAERSKIYGPVEV